jgi:Sulfotransferase family
VVEAGSGVGLEYREAMAWKGRLNRALGRATGWELRPVSVRKTPRIRVDPTVDRLLAAPVFILCSIRSGSTLLRALLDSHSELHAPHELHLRDLQVREASKYAVRAMRELGLDQKELEYLLWDRLLDWELQNSGKARFVNKTPADVFIWRRIAECWPDAGFIFLLRHPLAILRSRQAVRPQDSIEQHLEMVLGYANALEEARRELQGLTLRYEELTADPIGATKRVCDFLQVAWEPQMLDYGRFEHGRYRPGLGDWGEQIESGRVQPARALPRAEEAPGPLLELVSAWGYAADGGGAEAVPLSPASDERRTPG